MTIQAHIPSPARAVSPKGLAAVLYHLWFRNVRYRVLSCDSHVNVGNDDGVQMKLPRALAKDFPPGADVVAYNYPQTNELGLVSTFDGKPHTVPMIRIHAAFAEN